MNRTRYLNSGEVREFVRIQPTKEKIVMSEYQKNIKEHLDIYKDTEHVEGLQITNYPSNMYVIPENTPVDNYNILFLEDKPTFDINKIIIKPIEKKKLFKKPTKRPIILKKQIIGKKKPTGIKPQKPKYVNYYPVEGSAMQKKMQREMANTEEEPEEEIEPQSEGLLTRTSNAITGIFQRN